jgi:hypothetical protein
MPIKRHFLRLGVGGNGAHGLVVCCDACRRRRGPHAQTPEEAGEAARQEGFVAVKHREGSRDVMLWVCKGCFEEWPVRLRVTEFIAQKNRQRKGSGR